VKRRAEWFDTTGVVNPAYQNPRILDDARVASAQRRAAELCAVCESLHELLEGLEGLLSDYMPLDNWYLGFRDPTGLWAFPAGSDPHIRDFTPQELPASSLTEHTYLVGRPVRMDADHHPDVEGLGAASLCWLGVPLRAAGRVVGMFAVQTYEGGEALDGDEHAVMWAVAQVVGPAGQLLLERAHRGVLQQEIRADLDEAVAANNAKSTFLARMSHELRTPLNAIIGYNELLAEELEDLEVDEEFDAPQHIDKAARLLLQLVDEILDLSRLEAGAAEVSPEPVEVGEVVRQARAMVLALAEANGNQVELLLPAEPAWLTTDARMLMQCLINLGSNAAKFTREGTVTYRVKASESHVEIQVADTGMGIAGE
jgi:signal transduction histidine kinase